jgi:uncharacterized membrane protein YccC
MSAPPPGPVPASQTGFALRVALAAGVCLVLVERWDLKYGNLAVWTTHLVMAQYTFTIFQKGLERIIGRGLGVLAGLTIFTVCRNAPFLGLLLETLVLLPTFYVYFAGQLAYTFLNAGLFLAVVLEIGHADPSAVGPDAGGMMLAIVLGVVVADLVSWLTGAEHDLRIQPGGSPLWPVRPDWLNHSLMLVVTVVLTQLLTRWLELPAQMAVVSVMILSITPDIQAALRKSELRLLGALLATVWSLGTFLILLRQPYFPLLVGLLFLGIFVAAYLTRVGADYSYAGLQMGLVLPLVLVVPLPDLGSLQSAMQRLEGIVVAMAATLVVGSLWPHFPQEPVRA